MKVLGLIASPRSLGNSEVCVKEILRNLPKEWEKEIVNLSKLHIEPCKACYRCLSAGKQCVIQDDLKLFLEKIQWADKVVLACPVYFLGEQTSVKLIKDRLLTILNEGETFFCNKPCVIAIPHGIENWEGCGREAMLNFAGFLGLRVLGCRLINKHLPGQAAEEDSLAKLKALAGALVENKELSAENLDIIFCPGCQSSLLQVRNNGSWHCVMCGASGQLTADKGRLAIGGLDLGVSRYSKEGMEQHGRDLLEVNEEFRQKRREVLANIKKYKD